MKPEVHIFIVWHYASSFLGDIIEDLLKYVHIKKIFKINWSVNLYSENLTRFYGQNLPDGSDKEKHIGNGSFHAIIVEDIRPNYAFRQTTKGNVNVNANIFDLKQKYRLLTGGGHKIHASNNPNEAKRDIWLLLGEDSSAFSQFKDWDGSIVEISEDLIGANGWRTLSELFNTLNRFSTYVVLRNFESLPDSYYIDNHFDIDLMVDNLEEAIYLTNAKKAFPEEHRVHFYIKIHNDLIPFDFRYVGDNYYDVNFQKDILDNRKLVDGGFYVPSNVYYFYSLLYHAILHKPNLSIDYADRLMKLGTEIKLSFNGRQSEGEKLLLRFFFQNNYRFIRPKDLSVYYNESLASKYFFPVRDIPSNEREVENRVSNIIKHANDKSTFSQELFMGITDWPLEYHLSRARHCLVRPLGIKPGEKVLELGCGCGAITRYLGEIGAEVVAIEGSTSYARIAAERCQDLSNVKVFMDDLLRFETDERFDWILLVGVLEYAPVLTDEKEPTQHYLRTVARFLAPNGKLVIAIENKLGLKYFNGCSEDHLGTPYFGIQGLYSPKTPCAFGRRELIQQLIAAGFLNYYFYYPFPDYKLPTVILSEDALKDPQFDAVDLIIRSHARDYSGSPYRLFDESLVFSNLNDNALFAEFSNSFLVVATTKYSVPYKADRLAMTFGVNRIPEFSVVTSFYRSDDDIHVLKEPVLPDLQRKRQFQNYFNISNIPGKSIYHPGRQMLWKLLYVRANKGTLNQVVAELRPWVAYLLQFAVINGSHEPFLSSANERQSVKHGFLPGTYIDCTPFNLIESAKGLIFIDDEWQADRDVPLGWVITRGVLHSLMVGLAPGNSINSVADVVRGLSMSVGLSTTEAEVTDWIDIEARFISLVTGQALSDILISLGHPVSGLICLKQAMAEREEYISQAICERDEQIASLSQSIAERDGQITSLNQAVAKQDMQIAVLNQAIFERDNQIATLNQAVVDHYEQITYLNQAVAYRNDQINKIFSSRSWRLTKPLRLLGQVFRGVFNLALYPINRLLNKSFKNIGFTNTDDSSGDCNEQNEMPNNQSTRYYPSIVVILPVYRDIEMTRRCILAAMPGIINIKDAIMLAINDASPDEGMQEMLTEFVAKWPATFMLLQNKDNLGFVKTVNRGLMQYPACDVVLLNSDVIVPQDWLARLIEDAYSLPSVATVTPFSNNATICSFPVFLEENKLPFGLDVDSVDQVFRKYKLPCIEAPTGVGFCMYIRRACLDQIGYLNEERFGRGYGEENDLCQRALKSGWVNLLTPNIFVFHEGGVSFFEHKQSLVERAMRTIDELHPNYHRDIQEIINNDPIKPYRISRYIQLLSITRLPKILFVSHKLGGGVQQHIEELSDYYGNRAACMLLRPLDDDNAVILSLISGQKCADELKFSMSDDYDNLVILLKTAGVSLVHFHHTHGLNPIIWSLPSDLSVPHILTVHDYYWLNGNPTLTNKNGFYTEAPLDELKNPLFPLPDGIDVNKWQKNLRPLIESARIVIFPSNASRRIFGNNYKFKWSVVAPHLEIERDVAAPVKPFQTVGVITIGVLGALGREKGADFLEKIAVAAYRSECDIKFKLIGYAYRPLTAVEATGFYKLQDLPALIRDHKIDVVFFPTHCPETYSYTLSYALESGLPVVAPDIGAFPERLSGRKNVVLFKHGATASELLEQIIAFIHKLSKGDNICAPLSPEPLIDNGFYSSTYLNIATESVVTRDVENAIPVHLPGKLYQRIPLQQMSLNRCERVLALLWCIYQKPYMSRVARWIPSDLKRVIKRAFLKRPIHEIVRD